MHNTKTNFEKVVRVIKASLKEEINERGKDGRRGTVPKFSGIAAMALSLTAECLGRDRETHWFSKRNNGQRDGFNNLIDRRPYDDGREVLIGQTERVQKRMTARLNRQVDVFAINFRPLEMGNLARDWPR